MLNCAWPNRMSISRLVSPRPIASGKTLSTYALASSVCPSMSPPGASSSWRTVFSASVSNASCMVRRTAGDMPLLITVRTRWWSGGSSLSKIMGWPISSNGGLVELNVRQSRIISSICACRPVAHTSYWGE